MTKLPLSSNRKVISDSIAMTRQQGGMTREGHRAAWGSNGRAQISTHTHLRRRAHNGGAFVDGRMPYPRQRYLGWPNGVARRHQGRSR